jgi:hypothetical protein
MVFIQNVSTSQKVHHILELRVTRRSRLGIGDPSITGRPSHAVAHEIDRPLEKILSVVQQLF